MKRYVVMLTTQSHLGFNAHSRYHKRSSCQARRGEFLNGKIRTTSKSFNLIFSIFLIPKVLRYGFEGFAGGCSE